MARVLVARQPWGTLWEKADDRQLSVPLPGYGATINTTVYAAATGSATVSSFVTDSFGELPGWVEEGVHTLTVNEVATQVEAVSGKLLDRLTANVKAHPYNAVGDGVTNDTDAIQRAADAASPVVFPKGVYMISAPIIMRKGSRFFAHSTTAWHGGADFAVTIKAAANFTGTSLIKIWEGALTGQADPDGGSIAGIKIDGNNVGTGVYGIHFRGRGPNWWLRDLMVHRCTGTGVVSQSVEGVDGPRQDLHMIDVTSANNGGHGFSFDGRNYDHDFLNCIAQTNTWDGWFLGGNCAKMRLVSCRAEWSQDGNGFTIKSGEKITVLLPTTHRNNRHGIYVHHRHADPLEIIAPLFDSDGRSTTHGPALTSKFAAVRISKEDFTHCGPVRIVEAVVVAAADDDGNGPVGPDFGLWADGVKHLLFGGAVNAYEFALRDEGGNFLDLVPGTTLKWGGFPGGPVANGYTPLGRIKQLTWGVDGTYECIRTAARPSEERPDAVAVGIGAQWYDTALLQPIWSDGAQWRTADGALVVAMWLGGKVQATTTMTATLTNTAP